MDGNPNLLQLRALQALADSSGTLVLGLPNGSIPMIKQGERSAVPPHQEEKEEAE
jgi:hypothetical protein